MSIKDFLQKLNINAEEREISIFLKKYEMPIREFMNEKWDMFKQEELFAMQVKGKQIQLPVAKKDKDYAVPFNIHSIGLPDIADFSFENMPEGISHSSENNMIEGIPTVAGDHKIILRCVSNQGHKAEKELFLIVVPNPKDLWENIPTPTEIKYYKQDSDCQFLKVEAKNGVSRKDLVAASQRGRSHAHEGKPRDDDFALYFDEDTEWYTMVVADGAGSAKYSRKGSQIACQTAVEVCRTQLADLGAILEEQIKTEERKDVYRTLHTIVGKAAFEAHKEICMEANKEQCKPKDYATTLILCICKKFDFGWFVGAFWVGDGGIGIYNREKQHLIVLGEPDGGEFAGQTRFLTMQEIFKDRVRTRFEIVDDFTAIILMTDGVTDPKFETDANLNRIEKWDALWEDLNGANDDNTKVDLDNANEITQKVDLTDDNEQSAEQLLKWLDFWSKGNHDDRTIAILF